ncbi:hypothetical protein MBGDF03_00047 [Thermoplasmatales archaeon SCGC AB-540-F20]|nr:hypothetical protein MBGDF03_00047 [Thermoplasmatales archaeon SCGC AB-540-F20]
MALKIYLIFSIKENNRAITQNTIKGLTVLKNREDLFIRQNMSRNIMEGDTMNFDEIKIYEPEKLIYTNVKNTYVPNYVDRYIDQYVNTSNMSNYK